MNEYAKNIFIEQPNRFFVRSMVITERQAQVFHFDRSGVQHSPLFNIHDKPETLVRLILGLLTSQERMLGLDDTIQWTASPDGTKTRGFVRTVGPNAVATTYELITSEDPIVRSNLLGRGTTCWAANSDGGEKLIIKDYWIVDSPADRRPSEFSLLEEVEGLPGVCQMISYEDNRAQTRDFRGDTSSFPQGVFLNRRNIRIVMKAHGPLIESFTSIEQLLGALRDAIAAHKALVTRNIIHRDISPNNILLREGGTKEGPRGIIIDLDHALRTTGPASEVCVDFKTGTRMFQSAMVLKSCEMFPEYIPLYDYLDDLEAFFWVLVYIIISYRPNGDRMPRTGFQDRTMRGWSQEGPGIAHDCKRSFLIFSSTVYAMRKTMDPGWQVIYDDLFLGFRTFVRDITDEKDSLLYTSCTELPDGTLAPSRFEPILARIDDHYNRVLALFDVALEKIATCSPTIAPGPSNPPTQPAFTPAPLSTNSGHASDSPSVATSTTTVEEAILVEKTSTSPLDTKSVCASSSSSHAANLSTPHPRPKRRSKEAELDDELSKDPKRRCPPSRRQFREILGPVYQFCRALLE
ncbi:hypothetical protein EST38_g8910 [Candolleomyces aberdarensis]|uniref:Fungal-type protein kinase domain-containing protein n=1 Tax=Candolleomyces aberdarensis TaxID=2316362 RepID=A0A4Q2DBG1_9AGAR|nr:hypothetical protein EST38_g8910 [Candolleomyces aberdarensis]